MFEARKNSGTLSEQYELINASLEALSSGITNQVTILSNASALLNFYLEDINWVGFYLFEADELILGPFQGLPACTQIKVGHGVCGNAALDLVTYRVDNVLEFPGHIACDANSRSEIVIPIKKDNQLYGVLDIDSPIFNRFSEEEAIYLEKVVDILEKHL